MTTRIVGTLKQQQIPAVGFVNENKLYLKVGEVDARIAALNQWLDAGLELGNHAYSHPSFNKVGLKDFEESVIRGETVTKTLLLQNNMKLLLFRFLFLVFGRLLQSTQDVKSFITILGCPLPPATRVPKVWACPPVNAPARRSGDTALQQQIVTAFLK